MKRINIGVEHARKRSELSKKSFGNRFGVALFDCSEQEVLKDFIVGERLCSAF